ncbi:MAG: ribosomal L7Ae/L30e/S12e/Gadd45 family protein [Desulfotomaculaceae bacterium]|nr:ribosomal L7Ae/L30e/S12e/Gadd45 family protein [Desulfotomaculaceae bacterium]
MAIEQIISMAQRAGKLVTGNFALKDALAKKRVKLLIIAGDTAARTWRELSRIAGSKNITVITYSSKVELGRLIGKAPCSAVALTDEAMSLSILGALKRGDVNSRKHKSWR